MRLIRNCARVTIRNRHSVTAARSVAASPYGRPAYRCPSASRANKEATYAATVDT